MYKCVLIFHSSGVKNGLSRKDELFNDLVDDFCCRKLDWPGSQAPTEGTYFIQVCIMGLSEKMELYGMY